MEFMTFMQQNFKTETREVNKNTYLPEDVERVIFRENRTIVILESGEKGVAFCDENFFDPFTGFTTAYYKAKHSRCFDLKAVLKNCRASASKKGYAQAILKNR